MNPLLLDPSDLGNSNIPGQFYIANESRLTQGNFSEPLTAYATGWRDDEPIEEIINFLAPPVQVGRRFEYKSANNAEAFLSDSANQDLRAIGAEFKRVEYSGSTLTGKTDNRGLTTRIDHDDFPTNIPNWKNQVVERLLRRLQRNKLRRVTTAMLAAATNTAKTWDTTAGKDPDQDVISNLITALNESGVRPNRILFSDDSWNKRMLSHRAQNIAGGYASAGLTAMEAARLFAVDEVKIASARYVQAGAAATTKASIFGSAVLFFYAISNPSPDDPSNAKLFWTPCEDGNKYRVYIEEKMKYTDITVEHYDKLVVTTTLGLFKFTVS